jgi:hypothetical protein
VKTDRDGSATSAGETTLRPATAADVPRLTELAQAAYGRYIERLGGDR